MVDGVGVGEEEEFPIGGLCAGPAGVGLSGEPGIGRFVERWGCDGTNSEKFSCLGDYSWRGIGGTVVDEEEFPLLAELEAGFGLGDEGFDAGGQGFLLVACRNDDGEQKRRFVVVDLRRS